MFRIALCDDDPTFHAPFRAQLDTLMQAKHAAYELVAFEEATPLLEALNRGERFDLLFLDILIGKENGVELARSIRRNEQKTDIIFVTTSPEYALDSYDTAPLHYLLKPLSESKFEQAMERFFAKNIPAKVFLKTSSGMMAYSAEDILYFESYGHNIVLHTKSKTTAELSGTLKKLEQQLAPHLFVRIYKSYLLSLSCIQKIVRYRVTISSGEELPIGKERYLALQNEFLEYMARDASDF